MTSYYESQASVPVHLNANDLPLIITLLDSSFSVIKSGMGVLEAQVRPGIYKLRLSFGRAEHEEFIQVGEEGYRATNLDTKLKLHTSIPDTGSPIGHFINTHLSQMPAPASAQGRIVLIINTMDTDVPEGASFDLPLWTCELLDENYENIPIEPEDWHQATGDKAQEKAAIWSLNVDGGGYVLRWFLRDPNRRQKHYDNYKFLDQSLWVEAGWTTFVFLGFDSAKKRVRKSHTAIYFLESYLGYNIDPKLSKKMAAATQIVLTSLQKGSIKIDKSILNILLYEKFTNPMLGILACHALLYKKRPKWDLFDTILDNMSGLMPRHPDLLALRILKASRLEEVNVYDVEPITWPPMLYASYTAILKHDWNTEGEMISPDSQAAISLLSLLQQGPWAMWLTPENFEAESAIQDEFAAIQTVDEEMMARAYSVSSSRASQRVGVAKKQAYKRGVTLADKQAERIVRQYLQQSAKPRPYLSSLEAQEQEGLAQVSRKLGLPVSSVDKALQSITNKKGN